MATGSPTDRAQPVSLRPISAADTSLLCRLFYASVHQGTRDHYSAEQRQAWAPAIPDARSWEKRLRPQNGFVASRRTRPVGFMTMDRQGHIDLAFVAPDEKRKGIATLLYQAIEMEAHRQGYGKLTTEASLLAKPFFLRQGWEVNKANLVRKGNVSLANFLMSKTLLGSTK